jgi:DNA modification methylase
VTQTQFGLPIDDARAELAKAATEQFRNELEAGDLPLAAGQSVAAVLAMSSPPWHTATSNPFMREWVAAAASGDSREDPGPYLDDVVGSKATLQYKAHSYPTKVPPEVIVRLLLHYTRPGDVVLDGFAGSGMTGVAAQMCDTPNRTIEAEFKKRDRPIQWGARRAVLNDLAPNATFIASGVTLPVDADAFEHASNQLLQRLDGELGWMYKTRTPDGVEADIDYTVWSQIFTCPHCAAAVVYYDAAFVVASGVVAETFPCPSCGATVTKRSLERRKQRVRLLTGEIIERIELRPVLIAYRVGRGRGSAVATKRVDDADLDVLSRIASLTASGAPRHPFPYRHMTHERTTITKQGFTAVEHLYPDRALASLSRLWSWAGEEPDPPIRRALKFWVEQAFWGLSWMNRYKANDHSQVNRNQNGVFYISSLISECSPRYNLEGSQPTRGKAAGLAKLWRTVPQDADIRISTGDASDLPLDDDSIDYIFVDPPFGSNIYYADLAQMIEAWHGVLTQVEREAIVDDNKQATKGIGDYADLMIACFREYARVLKPGRWMTVEFSNSSNEVWAALQEALAAAGFVVADTRVLDKTQDSYRQATAVNAVKQDLMISCYKPAAATAEAVTTSSGSSVWAFVGEHLRHLPIVEDGGPRVQAVRERHPDRIYHRVVSYYVSAGLPVPMTAGEFYAGLESHYNERDGMYFRPDQVETYERKKMTFKALASTDLFVTDEKSAVAWLRQQLKQKPQRMSDIQPAYLMEIATAGERPDQLPDLRELLEQNFIQDETSGIWSVPDPRKVEHLEQLRTRDLLRTFDTYVTGSTGMLTRFRGEAVLAGFKKAWSDSDYATITKVAARLPQDYLVELPAVLAYVRNASARLAR